MPRRRHMVWVLFVLLLCTAVEAADPFAPGHYEVVTLKGDTQSTTGNVTWKYVARVPKTEEKASVLVMVTALGGMVPSEFYEEVTDMLARKGVASVLLWRIAGPEPRVDGRSLKDAISYLKTNLNTTSVNWDMLSIGGHSAGNHVWCDYLTDDCTPQVKGVVMVDPVDGYDPYGIINNYCTSTEHPLDYTLPALLMSTGLDPVPGPQGTACAPANMSNTRFYNAWAGPVWMINATEYGHLDVCDPSIEEAGIFFCASDKQPKMPYKRQLAGLVAAFFSLLNGSTDAAVVLTNTSAMPVTSIAHSNMNGNNPPYQTGCRYVQ